jgi:hypothetical protein
MTNIFDSSNSKNTDMDEWVQWIEEEISKCYIKYYEYNEFQNIQCVGSGAFGKVFKANLRSSNTVIALKSFIDNGCIMKEIINEVNNNNNNMRIF